MEYSQFASVGFARLHMTEFNIMNRIKVYLMMHNCQIWTLSGLSALVEAAVVFCDFVETKFHQKPEGLVVGRRSYLTGILAA